MRRVIDHPFSHAVVYGFCVGLWMLHAGLALGILGRRAGGAEGARFAHAGNFAAFVGICSLLLSPVALHLFGLRAAVAAMESDEAPAPKPPRQRREFVWAVLVYLVKDFKLASWLLLMFALAGHWVQRRSAKGYFAEEFGSLVFDISFISIAVIHMFVVCPRWIHEWRTGQKSCGLSTVLLSAQGGSMSGLKH